MLEVKEMLEELHNLKELGLINRWVIHKGKIAYEGNVNEQCFIACVNVEEWKSILKNINEIGKAGLL